MYISIFKSIDLIKTDWKDIILKQRSELEKIDNYLLSLHVTIPKFLVLKDGFLFKDSSINYFNNVKSVSINGDHSIIA